jgi:uncharacterized protein YbjT (DUF2867 family)
MILIIVCIVCLLGHSSALTNVLVTGGAGRTGKLVFQRLLIDAKYNPIAVVRTEKSKNKLIKLTKCDSSNVVIGDILNEEALTATFKQCDAKKLVLCSSAVPKIKLGSLLKVLLKKLVLRWMEPGRPLFRFIEKGDPYHVDFLGAMNQFKAAKQAQIDHVVVVSSMGGTQPENFLNSIGKIEGDEKSGNILLWKRKAEKFLIQICKDTHEADSSGMSSSSSDAMHYTIIHPGGLTDKTGGEREIIFGVDDHLLKEKVRNIPRADVAACCVASLDQPAARDRTFDIIAKPVEESSSSNSSSSSSVETNWPSWFGNNQGNCVYE